MIGAGPGFEALARWRHPSRGLLLPELFIPVRALGCGQGQGFLFSKPLPADQAERLLAGGLPTI